MTDEEGWTYGPDGAMFVPFIITDSIIEKNSKNIFDGNIFCKQLFLTKIFLVKIFLSIIFLAKIFFSYPSSIWLPYKQPLPLLSSSSVIFYIECDTTNEGRTYGPDAHNDCSFYCIRWWCWCNQTESELYELDHTLLEKIYIKLYQEH